MWGGFCFCFVCIGGLFCGGLVYERVVFMGVYGVLWVFVARVSARGCEYGSDMREGMNECMC